MAASGRRDYLPRSFYFLCIMKHDPSFLDRLGHRLKAPLPGLPSQLTMAPASRERNWKVPANARKSAVLVLLYPHGQQLSVALMKRSEDGQVHSGQISFPGGRYEEDDPDFTFTALREAEEEMGVPAQEVTVLGDLTELYIPPSNSLVYPKVGTLPFRPDFVPDPVEVAEVIEVSLGHLLNPATQTHVQVQTHQGLVLEAPGYLVKDQHIVWGATAMMMAEFLHLVQEVREA